MLVCYFLSLQPDSSLHCEMMDMDVVWLMHSAVCLFTPPPSFTFTHCACPLKDGGIELS